MIDIKVVELSPLGLPISTGDIWSCTRKDLTGITRWKGSVRGPACSSYPHPKFHTLEGIVKNKPLQDITINDITRCLKERHKKLPSCTNKWDHITNKRLPWREIGKELSTNLGTPKDTSAWFKNILHRAFLLKGKQREHHNCTACGEHNEDWDHFWRCEKFQPTWKRFIDLANATDDDEEAHEYSEELIYLGVRKDNKSIKGSLALLHKLIWKFILIDFTGASIEGKQIKTRTIWKRALRRLVTRLNAQARAIERRNTELLGRDESRKWTRINKLAKPLAHIDPDSATLEWHRKMEIELRKVHALEGEAENEDEQGEERDEEEEEEEELRRLEDGDPDAEEILTQ